MRKMQITNSSRHYISQVNCAAATIDEWFAKMTIFSLSNEFVCFAKCARALFHDIFAQIMNDYIFLSLFFRRKTESARVEDKQTLRCSNGSDATASSISIGSSSNLDKWIRSSVVNQLRPHIAQLNAVVGSALFTVLGRLAQQRTLSSTWSFCHLATAQNKSLLWLLSSHINFVIAYTRTVHLVTRPIWCIDDGSKSQFVSLLNAILMHWMLFSWLSSTFSFSLALSHPSRSLSLIYRSLERARALATTHHMRNARRERALSYANSTVMTKTNNDHANRRCMCVSLDSFA